MSFLRDFFIVVLIAYVVLYPVEFGVWLGVVVANAEQIIYTDCDCTEPLE